MQQRPKCIDSLACGSRNLVAFIANGLVKMYHLPLIMPFVGRQYVAFIEHKYDRYVVSLSRSEEPIDEGCAGLWVIHSDNKECLVHVGSKNMALFAKVLRLPDNVIATVFYMGYECCLSLIKGNFHPVSHGNRIGAADTFQAEIALNLAFDNLTVVTFDGIPAAGVLDD